MDVFCVGMYRSCSTWQYEVAAHLLEAHRDGRRLGYQTGDDYDAREAGAARRGRWRVLKSHEGHPSFAAALRSGRAVALYAHRDLRDVVDSMLHKRGVSFAEFVRQGMVHQVLANDRFWRRQPYTLVQRYEDLVADPARGVAELAEFLGVELQPGEAEQVAAEYSLQANRRRTVEISLRLRAAGVDVADPANAQRFDDHTLLHWNHVREGRVGGWLERATPRRRAVLARLVGRWLVENEYEADLRWAHNEGGAPPEAGEESRLRWAGLVATGWLRCSLRCASLRHPRTAAVLKRALGLSRTTAARPIPAVRADEPTARAPHDRPAKAAAIARRR